ncbi:MAG: hypothetical protein COW27_05940 [Nitrosopumilales archaeon CG15_BIG_FIL_POST_REV_8_21_14_020_37_12]|nr:MAG: hypothetical protein COW27_05940 [Nitrosopumilales archaeon CG15_BIG_FIL_POST_REV_8_21_14_020_37_12]
MSDPLFDDVKELLDKEKGDERILKQILRACENNEVISNYERNYVRKLAEKHLGRKPLEDKPAPKPVVPDVVIPQPMQPQVIYKEPPRARSSPKKTKMMLGIGAAALAVIALAVIGSVGLPDFAPSDVTRPDADVQVTGILLELDSSSYKNKDIISISGKSDSGTVNLSIENQDGVLVWSEQLRTKSNGSFSTLVIAAGPGWEKSGTFTLKAENDSEIQTKKFSFNV